MKFCKKLPVRLEMGREDTVGGKPSPFPRLQAKTSSFLPSTLMFVTILVL